MGYELRNMAYSIFPKDTGAKNYINLVTSTGVQGEYLVANRFEITRLKLSVATTIANSTAAAVVTFRLRPTPGSATGQSTLGTITVVTAGAAPTVYENAITPVIANAGNSIAFDLTTQGTDASSAAGTAYASFDAHLLPEDYRNESNVVKVSA